MDKIAFIFPGQGVQKIGMGKDIYENYSCARKIYDRVSEATNMDIASLCFEENDKINITEFTQVALLTTELAILEVVCNVGLKPDVCAGLSIGEYSALVATEAISIEDAARLVKKRGNLMHNAMPEGNGTMSAILGLETDIVEGLCKNADGIVEVANYNSPVQTVISGEKHAVKSITDIIEEEYMAMVVELNVSGAFHSSLLESAGEALSKEIKITKFADPKIAYVANLTAELIFNKEQIGELLVKQVSNPVLWQKSVKRMIDHGVNTFIEIGPGKTLAGFNKEIDRNVKTINLRNLEDIHRNLNRKE